MKARPWDIFNKNLLKVETEIFQERLSICKSCPEYISTTHQCKKCGCFMNIKAKIGHAECPLDKWEQVIIETTKEI